MRLVDFLINAMVPINHFSFSYLQLLLADAVVRVVDEPLPWDGARLVELGRHQETHASKGLKAALAQPAAT